MTDIQYVYFGEPDTRCWAHAMTCSASFGECPYDTHECNGMADGPLGLCERHREELLEG